MKKEVCLPEPVTADGGTDDLNRWLGRREAFSLIAGRCSAADVECMRRIRDGKLYLGRARDWAEFCQKVLHISKSLANSQIAMREKYGDQYFHIAQLTRISAANYKTIAPAVSAQGLECNGEVIPLQPENGERLAAAVSTLLAAADAEASPSFRDRVTALDSAAVRLLEQFRELAKNGGCDDPYLIGTVSSLRDRVDRLSMEIM